MKRFLTLILLPATMLAVTACGGSDTGNAEQPTPTESRQTQAESTPDSMQEATQKRGPVDDTAESEQGATQEGEESSGLRVTTMQGEEVRLGGQGDVTALFFMAGW